MFPTFAPEDQQLTPELAALVASGTISRDLASAMTETKRLCAEPCATCGVGRGRWCDHRSAGKRTVSGEVGR